MAYGLRGWNGVVSVCGLSATSPYISDAAGLVEADRPVGGPHGLEHAERAHRRCLGGELGHLEADLDVALGAQVVDLVRLDLMQVPDQRRRVGQVSVVQEEPGARFVRVVVEVVDPPGRERGSSGG